MRRIKLNQWFVDKNNMSICLMHFFVEFIPYIDDNGLYFILQVRGENREELFLRFETSEECILFTERINENCQNMNDVVNEYKLLDSKHLVKKISI